MIGRVTAAALVLVLAGGCAIRRWDLRTFPRCADGLPVEILIDPACPPDGVCGYSCLPGRWGTSVAGLEAFQNFNLR